MALNGRFEGRYMYSAHVIEITTRHIPSTNGHMYGEFENGNEVDEAEKEYQVAVVFHGAPVVGTTNDALKNLLGTLEDSVFQAYRKLQARALSSGGRND
jgi:ribulose-5-phosphate 4-epimerase/fuculose-1-phosphate aldolase